MLMRTFIISDVHGNNSLFRKSLKTVGLKKADKLIILGDLIDRGKDSKGVLDTILLMLENGFEIEILLGNHEEMFLDSFKNPNNLNKWMLNGGDKTLQSFLTSKIEKIPPKYVELIQSFKTHLEIENYILVHAAVNMKISDPFEDIKTILWEREPIKYLDLDWLGDRKVIHGHHPKSKVEIIESIKNKNPIIGIDNGVYLKNENYGSLCILELETLKFQFIYED